MLVSLVLSLFVSSAQAEEPTTVPATVTVAPRVNRPGLRNKAPSVVTFDEQGCPRTHDLSPQYRTAEEVKTIMGAATDASVRCVLARAKAQAMEEEHLLATAGAYVARGANDRGQEVYLDAHNGVVATGNAAFVAAAASNGSVGGISPLGSYGYNQAAWGLTRPPVPVVTTAPSLAVTPKPATVSEAESRIRGVE